MWNSAIIVYCLLSSSIEMVPAPGRGALKGYCITNNDCKRNQCCLSFDSLQGTVDLSEDLKRFVDGKCVKRGKTGSDTCVKECFTSDDCKSSECCVSYTHPIGKRSAELADKKAPGKCTPLGKKGSDCLVNNGSGKPTEIVFHSCPCKKRTTCVGSGNFEIPLGETGICRRKEKTKNT